MFFELNGKPKKNKNPISVRHRVLLLASTCSYTKHELHCAFVVAHKSVTPFSSINSAVEKGNSVEIEFCNFHSNVPDFKFWLQEGKPHDRCHCHFGLPIMLHMGWKTSRLY